MSKRNFDCQECSAIVEDTGTNVMVTRITNKGVEEYCESCVREKGLLPKHGERKVS